MDIVTLTRFFMWCTIINGGVLSSWTIFFLFAPNLVYRTQCKWVNISQENFTVVMYVFLGLFKIMFLIFNVVPFIVLLIIS
jgi:hypothetical protein